MAGHKNQSRKWKWGHFISNVLHNSLITFTFPDAVFFIVICSFVLQCLIRIRWNWKCSPICRNKFKRQAFSCSGEKSSSSLLLILVPILFSDTKSLSLTPFIIFYEANTFLFCPRKWVGKVASPGVGRDGRGFLIFIQQSTTTMKAGWRSQELVFMYWRAVHQFTFYSIFPGVVKWKCCVVDTAPYFWR